MYFSSPSVFYVLSESTCGLFYFGVSLLSLAISTWCGKQIARKISIPDNIIFSCMLSMSPSLLWPFTLPVTYVAFMFYCCPNRSVLNPFTYRRNKDDTHQKSSKPTYKWCISKFKLDSSKLVQLEATPREIEWLKSIMKDDSCPVCLDNMKVQKMKDKQHPDSIDTCATKCWHIFHYNCITGWFLKSKTCPTCRKNNLMEQLRFYYLVYRKG